MVNEGWALTDAVRSKIKSGVATSTGTSAVNQIRLHETIANTQPIENINTQSIDRNAYVPLNPDYNQESTSTIDDNVFGPQNASASQDQEVDTTKEIPTEWLGSNAKFEQSTGWGHTGGSATVWKNEDGPPAIDTTKKKIYTTPGGAKTTLNLNIESNKHLGGLLDIMELQKKNMPGNVGKFGGFNQITGEALLPKHTPGTQKFEIKHYIPNEKAVTSHDAWFNIGKNVDSKQFQNTLDNQSLNKFENYLHSNWSKNVRGGVAQQSDIFGQIKNSNISAAEKKRLTKEYEKKTKNYQNAIGGTKEKPWEWGKNQPDVSTGPGLLSGKVDKKGETIDWKKLSDPNFSFE